MVAEFTDSNFKESVETGITVVDFWAEWCGPCKMIAPIIEELSNEYDGQVKFAKVNVDHNPELSMTYNIRSIPTILLFNNGEVVDKVVGAVPKAKLEEIVKAYV